MEGSKKRCLSVFLSAFSNINPTRDLREKITFFLNQGPDSGRRPFVPQGIGCPSFMVPSTRASSAAARASMSVIAAIALSIPTLSVKVIGLVLAFIITVIFAVIKLLPKVVIKIKLLCLIRANSGINHRF